MENEKREKKTFIVKAKLATKTSGRVCLNCGINIDHKSRKVEFCCPACKAAYKEKQWLDENERKNAKPRKKYHTNPDALPYQSYSTPIEKFNARYNDR